MGCGLKSPLRFKPKKHVLNAKVWEKNKSARVPLAMEKDQFADRLAILW
jgi:predicted small lipoprotein YifL